MNENLTRYHLRRGNYLVVGKSSKRRITFAYKECISMVDLPWIPSMEAKYHQRYSIFNFFKQLYENNYMVV